MNNIHGFSFSISDKQMFEVFVLQRAQINIVISDTTEITVPNMILNFMVSFAV
jgi:hypothetical protein